MKSALNCLLACTVLVWGLALNGAALAEARTVGERLDSTKNSIMPSSDVAPDLSSRTLVETLPGDWLTLDAVSLGYADQVGLTTIKEQCSLPMHLEQPDPLYPIFEGKQGLSRFELRLLAGGSFVRIDDVKDRIHALGLDKPKPENADAASLQRGLMMQTGVTRGAIVPLNNDVLVTANAQGGLSGAAMIRCPDDPEDKEKSARDLHLAMTVLKEIANRSDFLAISADGSAPFVSKMQGSWTLLDEPIDDEVRDKSVDDLCRVRRIEMRADHQPLPILAAHVADVTVPEDRPVPASDDQFELRLVGDGQLLRVALHDPVPKLLQNRATLAMFQPDAGTPGTNQRSLSDQVKAKMTLKDAIDSYGRTILSSALPVMLVPMDDDTLVETTINPWGPGSITALSASLAASKRYWLRCPS